MHHWRSPPKRPPHDRLGSNRVHFSSVKTIRGSRCLPISRAKHGFTAVTRNKESPLRSLVRKAFERGEGQSSRGRQADGHSMGERKGRSEKNAKGRSRCVSAACGGCSRLSLAPKQVVCVLRRASEEEGRRREHLPSFGSGFRSGFFEAKARSRHLGSEKDLL